MPPPLSPQTAPQTPVRSSILDPDTIVAIATPPGRGGIGIIRLSGPLARSIAGPLLRFPSPLVPNRARFAELLDPEKVTQILDQAVVTFFAAPNSYTSQDVVEISLHGAPILLQTVLRACIAAGARLALPGEFTQRAFLSGRLDLPAAEAVRDLIDAQTLHQARTAAAQLSGALSAAVAAPKRGLITLIASLEAGIDFGETETQDQLDTPESPAIAAAIAAIAAPLRTLAAGFTYSSTLRDGFTLTLAGRPNAGKSSLFNALLGRERAIVTPHPGTTRDTLAEPFALAGIPIVLTDTAGIRPTATSPDAVDTDPEHLGIVRTHAALAAAHHTLLLVDSTTMAPGLPLQDEAIRATLGPHSLVLTKSDLLSATDLAALTASHPAAVALSTLTAAGLPALLKHLTGLLNAQAPSADTVLVTNLRHQTAITEALTALATARKALDARTPHEMLLLDLYAALTALDDLTGATPTDAILHEIFATFCIGK